MATRGPAWGEPAVDLALTAETFARLAGAIVLDTLALVVWNVGTRAPLDVLRDVRAASRRPRRLVAGAVSLIAGFIFVAAGTVLVVPALANVFEEFVPIEIYTFLVALALEYLVGNDVRTGLMRFGSKPRS